MLRAQPVEMRAGLAAEMQQMLEAGGADERRPRAAPFEQRVRRSRRPVREALHVLRADRARRREHRLLLPRRGRHLRRPHRSAVEEDGVRERAAHVDAQDRHVRTLHRRADPRLPLRLRRAHHRHGDGVARGLAVALPASTASSSRTRTGRRVVGTIGAPFDPMAHLEELAGRPLAREDAERAALRARALAASRPRSCGPASPTTSPRRSAAA